MDTDVLYVSILSPSETNPFPLTLLMGLNDTYVPGPVGDTGV